MLKAALVWLVTFGMAAMLARGWASCMAFQLTMPFPSYDDEKIYGYIKSRVFSRIWLLSALASSTLIAGAMLVPNEVVMLLLTGAGVILLTAVPAVQGYRLFHVAVAELGLPWPPETGL